MNPRVTRQILLSALCGAVLGLIFGGAAALAFVYCASFGDAQELLGGTIFLGAGAIGMVAGAMLGGRAVHRHFRRLLPSRSQD